MKYFIWIVTPSERLAKFLSKISPKFFDPDKLAKDLISRKDYPLTGTMEQYGVTVWFTGLSGAGKTTITSELARILKEEGFKVEILDGDTVREGLTRDLGFSREDRDENIHRISFVSHLLTRNDVIVLVSAISPYREAREKARQQVGDNFIEVFVNAPLNVCEDRDVKGLYKRARAGEIKGFTGIDDPYEAPSNPEVECRTDLETLSESVAKVRAKMEELWVKKSQAKATV